MAVLPTRQFAEVESVRGPVPYQQIDTNANMFGMAQARGLVNISNAGQNLGEVLTAQANKEDTTGVLEAYSAGKDQLRDSLYNPQTGYYTRSGGAAKGGVSEFSKLSDDIMQKAASSLPPGKAQDAFRKMWINERDTMLDGVARHEASEGRKYDAQVAQGVVDVATTMAGNAYNDPKVIAKSIDDIRRSILHWHFAGSIGHPHTRLTGWGRITRAWGNGDTFPHCRSSPARHLSPSALPSRIEMQVA